MVKYVADLLYLHALGWIDVSNKVAWERCYIAWQEAS